MALSGRVSMVNLWGLRLGGKSSCLLFGGSIYIRKSWASVLGVNPGAPECPEWGVGFIALVPLPRNMPLWDGSPRSTTASVKANLFAGVSNLATK